jgi:hypothetical protein
MFAWFVVLVMAAAGCSMQPDTPEVALARQDMKSIKMALDMYDEAYEALPFTAELAGIRQDVNVLIDILVATNTPIAKLRNPDGIKLISRPGNNWADPWGTPYNIFFDDDADGRIRLGEKSVKAGFLIWSSGPDRKDDQGAGDDIRGW